MNKNSDEVQKAGEKLDLMSDKGAAYVLETIDGGHILCVFSCVCICLYECMCVFIHACDNQKMILGIGPHLPSCLEQDFFVFLSLHIQTVLVGL